MPLHSPIPSSSVMDPSQWDDELFWSGVHDAVFPGRRSQAAIDRQTLIAQAMSTPEGRTALAQAMVEPIRRSLEFQNIGSRLFMVDELPEGAFASYEP